MPKRTSDTVQEIAVLEERAKGIADWLRKHHPECLREQKHLDEGTRERFYWHYGYMVALRDVLRFLKGEKLINPDRNLSDIPSSFPWS